MAYNKNKNDALVGEWVGSMLLFTALVCVGIWWVSNNMSINPGNADFATTTPKVVSGLPNVVTPAKIIFATIQKSAFPSKNGIVPNLLEATGKYPSNTPSSDFAKKHVNEFIDSFIADYPNSTDIQTAYGVNADGEVSYFHGKKLLSYLYTDYRFDGGAHGNSQFSSETFDMNGKKYSLADLFLPNSDYLGVISHLAIAHFTKDPDINFNPKDVSFGAGLDPKIENFGTFFISEDSIIFQFQSYQILPYSDGAPQFEISVNDSELKSIINPKLFK